MVYTPYMTRPNIAKERKLAEKIEKAAASFREWRIAEKLPQARVAENLGVTTNTVARWERCEVPIPQWVARLQSSQAKTKELQTSLASLTEEKKKLGETIKAKDLSLVEEKKTLADTVKAHAIEIKFLKGEIAIIKAEKQIFRDLENKVKGMYHPPSQPAPVEEFYRDLAKEFHPDRNPQHAEAMKTINAIYQRRIRRV
jgi:transcriptional regulator with XRE-family HTH domain